MAEMDVEPVCDMCVRVPDQAWVHVRMGPCPRQDPGLCVMDQARAPVLDRALVPVLEQDPEQALSPHAGPGLGPIPRQAIPAQARAPARARPGPCTGPGHRVQ